ncbi:MAG: PHP domain-containing protein [Phycisphaerales bacterium]|nr:MAG: PHP domain-containing protein [Phycisphaerales bacterium]
MKIRLKLVLLLVTTQLLLVAAVQARINFPDIPGRKTLKCDLHMHTVFSDGSVWPSVRVDEALRLGLDAIALTDHIEYQPHKDDIPTNHNRPYEIAAKRAKDKNLLLIKGAEFTRETPPGHFNAIFVNDINPLVTEELTDAIKAAADQGALISWNHPFWKKEAKGWEDFHTRLYDNKWLRAIEVANGRSYYPEVFKWALDKNLTMLGNSDMHAPADFTRTSPENHRTITLVFAAEKSLDALKQALLEGRTAVWYKNQVVGRKKYLEPLFNASIRITRPTAGAKKRLSVQIINSSDLDIQLERVGKKGPKELTLPANAAATLKIKPKNSDDRIRLSYLAKNFLIAPDKPLPVTIDIPLK